ncbi:hypothetical protein [Leptolyngbya sp. 7M]|uniref:hypothetical protein n=1 Tax=Leptolyngbya sp. 7M TaxID=2812896 RepID=UPI001B8BD8F0|nr:hypothetical protein [Leptolyngbya sp. 7M]QYO64288.1 hypothetical protein JVX88_31975 [Leptolyngbya sp. 7M]
MTRSARPDNWQDLIAGYALGNLSPEEAEALQQLLSEHPELAEEVNRLRSPYFSFEVGPEVSPEVGSEADPEIGSSLVGTLVGPLAGTEVD